MGLLSRNSDYTDADFASMLLRARGLISSVFPKWTDDKVANIANLLVELFCFVMDVLGFTQNRNAAEAFITTCTQRKNALAHAKLVGYVPAGAKAATVDVTFTLAAPVPALRTVTFNPPGNPTPTNPTTVSTEDASSPIEFELISPVVITAGNSTGTGTVKNSTRQGPETFTSTVLPDQRIRLSQTPYLDASAVVTAANGSYSQVANFLQSLSSDRVYVVQVDELDRATLLFPNGVNGAIPTGSISATYETGGGLAGLVPAGSIKKIAGQFQDSSGAPVTVTVNNAQPSTGGDDRESIEQIRENIPVSIRALERTVSRTDFEDNAKIVPGVERALFLTRNEDGSIPENSGFLYVVPTGLGFPSVSVKNDVLTAVAITKPHTVTFAPTVTDPFYVDIGVKATIFLKPGFSQSTVRANIIAAVAKFFALRNDDGTLNSLVDFGFNLKLASGAAANEVALSDLENVVRDIDGVREIGDGITDFQLIAYRLSVTTTSYTGGGTPAALVQAYAHTDVPLNGRDFPRMKMSTFGGASPDVDLTIDGTHYSA